jgi:endonuclease G
MSARRRWNSDGPDYDQIVNVSARALRRLDPRAQVLVVVLLIAAAAVAAAVMYHRARPDGATTNAPTAPSAGSAAAVAVSPNLLLGNPSSATSDPANRNNYLMVKPFFALSYNDSTGAPNWVSWRVVRSDLGDSPRKPGFDPDLTLPAGFKVVTTTDYSGSGFDRGHMCPHSDRAANQEMSYATFVMSNIIPQAPNVNGKAWNNLEMYCRDLVRRGGASGKRLYVVAGPAGRGGRGSRGPRETIGGRGAAVVVVPAECWKVIVVVADDGADDPSRITADARVIAVVMPNDNDAVGDEWAKYRVTAAAIEQRTGLKFFDRLAPDVADTMRRKLDDVAIAPPRSTGRGR